MEKSIQERIAELTPEEALEIISKMGMNMYDHPYLSEARRSELEQELDREKPCSEDFSGCFGLAE